MMLTTEEKKAFFLLMGINGKNVHPDDEQSLKKAFRTKAKASHPDLAVSLGKDPRLMELRFQELNDAFNILMERLNREKMPNPIREQRASPPANTRAKAKKQKHTASRKKENVRSTSEKKRTNFKEYKHHSGSETNTDTKDFPFEDFYYKGRTPGRNLRFAEYLYYTGDISWTDLVQALVWQYRNRPKLGELASESGLLSFEEVLDIIKGKKSGELFGEAAVRMGYLDKRSLNDLIRQQKQMGYPIGHYFTGTKKMSRETLYKKLKENRRHNILNGDEKS